MKSVYTPESSLMKMAPDTSTARAYNRQDYTVASFNSVTFTSSYTVKIAVQVKNSGLAS